MRGKQLAGCGE